MKISKIVHKPRKKPKNYVNNKDLFDSIVQHQYEHTEWSKDPSGPAPQVSAYIGECFFHMSTRISSKPNFSGYSYKEDMILDGVEDCIKYIKTFNPAKTQNPFAYFTTSIINAFIRRIHKEKKEQYIKYKNLQNLFTEEDLISHGAVSRNGVFLDTATEFVKKYEKAIEDKKNLTKKGVELFVIDEKENILNT